MFDNNMTHVNALASKLGTDWPCIEQAKLEAIKKRQKISDLLSADGTLLPKREVNIVVFGSLARCEWTDGSDVDWTLLIDGPADPEHRRIAQLIAKKFQDNRIRKPGPTGVFGNMAFSHDIIHQIGGEQDTNRNITQRILLLLESKPLLTDIVYDRVVETVLDRYIEDDLSLFSHGGKKYKIPRFLLNDIVRFWRTMAVDFAYKRYERADEGWAIRNIKLRMSRKLIFVSGLLTCFSCFLNPTILPESGFNNGTPDKASLINHLLKYVKMSPLEVLAETLYKFGSKQVSLEIFDAYNRFIDSMSKPEIREHLNKLKVKEADNDSCFSSLCEISQQFQKGLVSLFFDSNDQLTELTRKYGVF
ncbi:MAG: nucleotidyltransferase domain-containing protein [Anaerohalosphaera sp.]|nr:nucleotidyltransferase domain-containing protein [Anaerohalosphaera sp.]